MVGTDVVTEWTLDRQCDALAIDLWNAYADGDVSALEPVTVLLKEDFPTFCGLLLKVRPKGGGYTVPFLFNQVQRRMWREMCAAVAEDAPLWFVILKFRQAGMSTFWCAWLFWQMWRQVDVQTMIVAHQLQTAETMIETMKVFYDELPDVFRPDLREGNHGASIPRGEVYFADRRTWCMIHLSKNVDPRGQQVTHVLETEQAMYGDKAEELNSALMPQLPPFGSEARLRSSFIVESTPKGVNYFHDLYFDAKKGILDTFRARFFPWFLFDEQYAAEPPKNFRMSDHERQVQKRLSRARMEYPIEDGGGKEVTRAQMYWRRQTINTEFRGDEEKFRREYPEDDRSCWMLSSKSVFKGFSDYLEQCIYDAQIRAEKVWSGTVVNGQTVVTKGPVRIRLIPKIEPRGSWKPITHVDFEISGHGSWRVWEPPVPGHKYVVGADPSLGLDSDADNSVICVLDVTAGRQVAEFADTIAPERFAVEIAAAGYWYNQAMLIPEINNIGYVVLNHLIAVLTYPNIYRWPKFDEVNKYTHKRGFETNFRTKQLMVSTLIATCDEQSVAIASKELWDEMSTFEATESEYKDGWEFSAQKGRTDDRVMAYGLALMAISQTPHLEVELSKSKGKMPSARELGIAETMAVQERPMPTKLAEKLQRVQAPRHWNPFADGDAGIAI